MRLISLSEKTSPVLRTLLEQLVGETGCSKITVVEVIAKLNSIKLFRLNCHNNTESSDFLGGLRPDRESRAGCCSSG